MVLLNDLSKHLQTEIIIINRSDLLSEKFPLNHP